MESIPDKPLYRKPELTRLSIVRSMGKVKAEVKETSAQSNEAAKQTALVEDNKASLGLGNNKPSN